jgi:hypothetical protein
MQLPVADDPLSGTVTFSAVVSGGGIGGVQFQVDGINVGLPDSSSPYSLSFNTAQFPNSVHAVSAYTWDNTKTVGRATPVSVWDPVSATMTAPHDGADMFCAGHITLPDGRTLSAGGHIADHVGLPAGSIFNPVSNQWTSTPNMSYGRWYPTLTALPDGRVLALSGETNCAGCYAQIPEAYDPVANTWTPLSNAPLSLPYYPHVFVLPDGRIVVTGPPKIRFQPTFSISRHRAGRWSIRDCSMPTAPRCTFRERF